MGSARDDIEKDEDTERNTPQSDIRAPVLASCRATWCIAEIAAKSKLIDMLDGNWIENFFGGIEKLLELSARA